MARYAVGWLGGWVFGFFRPTSPTILTVVAFAADWIVPKLRLLQVLATHTPGVALPQHE